jgi:hypothetical protein
MSYLDLACLHSDPTQCPQIPAEPIAIDPTRELTPEYAAELQKKVPYHQRADFLEHPPWFRRECLYRNPIVLQMIGEAAQGVVNPLARCRVRKTFGISGVHLDRTGPDSLVPGGADTVELADTEHWQRDGQCGNLFSQLDTVAKEIAEFLGCDTVRNRREIVRALREQRFAVTGRHPQRQRGTYYHRLLVVWDRREGWTGQRYDPLQAVYFREAKMASKAKKDAYYRVFKIITGEAYSSLAWDLRFGTAWCSLCGVEAYRKRLRMATRRHRGRHRPVVNPDASPSYHELPEESLEFAAQNEVEQFYNLLHTGVEVHDAIAQVALPEHIIQQLLDPNNTETVAAFAARQRPA